MKAPWPSLVVCIAPLASTWAVWYVVLALNLMGLCGQQPRARLHSWIWWKMSGISRKSSWDLVASAGRLSSTVNFQGWKPTISLRPYVATLVLLETGGQVGGSSGVVGCTLNINASRPPQWDHMGSGCWVCQRGSVGGECYTLAVNVEMGPVFHSHSSQMPLYSVPPPFIPPFRLPLFPPPINDPFVRVFFAAVGWRASAGPSPKTSRLSWNCFLSQSIICGPLSYSFFFYHLPFLIAACPCLPDDYSSYLFTIFVLIWHVGWWIFEIPALLSLFAVVQHFLHQSLPRLYAFRRPLSLCPLKACTDVKIDF